MIEKNLLVLTIPFLGLLAGFVFTYFQVWHKRASRDATEAQVTDDIVAQLRAQRKEAINTESDSEDVLWDKLTDVLEKHNIEIEERLAKYERLHKLLDSLASLDALDSQTDRRRKEKSCAHYLDFGISNGVLSRSCFGETQASMQILAEQANPLPYGRTPAIVRPGIASKVRHSNIKKGAIRKAKP
ncbi:hypothetical protein ABPD30_004060 [Vibrio parahaemolyticus]|nr:hypothetical protein [Vibrio parahaemolyticus]EJG1828090.1 hypothetical protein [Vibrio parahaemolyticus]ELC9530964.1 hypothetical protein [Vibrio parahaemolyticus]MBM5053879.1 hypothetical protein [Vibrio parahaemolyticus]